MWPCILPDRISMSKQNPNMTYLLYAVLRTREQRQCQDAAYVVFISCFKIIPFNPRVRISLFNPRSEIILFNHQVCHCQPITRFCPLLEVLQLFLVGTLVRNRELIDHTALYIDVLSIQSRITTILHGGWSRASSISRNSTRE